MNLLSNIAGGVAISPISPGLELGAYEALWLERGATFKTIAAKFAADPDALPSDLVSRSDAELRAGEVLDHFIKRGISRFGIRINHAGEYPAKIRDARHPVELLYYRGTWELAETRCVAVVGTRKPTDEGRLNAERVAQALVANGFTVVSGLATGIDTVAHRTTIESGGRTIAVVGTPLGSVYPRENEALQELIAAKHLLITQVPVLRYARQAPPQNRLFFPERNVTMSALTDATVIVEAGETSGTLIQARAAIEQGRRLFILEAAFRSGLKWPTRLQSQGAIRLSSPAELIERLGSD